MEAMAADGDVASVCHRMGDDGEGVPVASAMQAESVLPPAVQAQSVLPPVMPPSPTGDGAVETRVIIQQEVVARPTGPAWEEDHVRPRHRGLRGCLAGLVTFLHSMLLASSCGRLGKCE